MAMQDATAQVRVLEGEREGEMEGGREGGKERKRKEGKGGREEGGREGRREGGRESERVVRKVCLLYSTQLCTTYIIVAFYVVCTMLYTAQMALLQFISSGLPKVSQ